jgi:hypothetical protein
MPASHQSHHKKRHGKHQKQTKDFLNVYWPYVPLLLIILTGLVFTSLWQPRAKHGVLAYATSMGIAGLLSATNQQRAVNGVPDLAINSQLNSAAQAKANDMVARNYWSHNTPDGNPPWVFFDQAGYAYKNAGENLAYGFSTSDDTITGWMNSPSHRDNLLNTSYKDVGFGFADSSDFQSTGPETIVVAEYGSPLNASAAPAAVATTPPAARPAVQSAATTTPPSTAPTPPVSTPAPAVAQTPAPTPVSTTTKPAAVATTAGITNNKPVIEPAPQKVSRLTAITAGSLPWLTTLATITSVTGVAVLIIKHGLGVRKWLMRGERYVLHHMLFDVTIASLVGLCVIVSQTAGVIR